jgi:hypothetical protein
MLHVCYSKNLEPLFTVHLDGSLDGIVIVLQNQWSVPAYFIVKICLRNQIVTVSWIVHLNEIMLVCFSNELQDLK